MRISDWSSEVCSSDLAAIAAQDALGPRAAAEIDSALWIGVAGAIVALLLGLVLSTLVGRGISKPVVAMTAAMDRLAKGDKATEVPAQGRKDEIGRMAAAVQVFKENAIEMDRLQAEQEAQKARAERSEEHTSELQSLMRNSY